MDKFLIRYNKSKGQPGRGTHDHVWRVFKNGDEYLARHVKINVPCWDEKDGPDTNIACTGSMILYSDTDTVVIS